MVILFPTLGVILSSIRSKTNNEIFITDIKRALGKKLLVNPIYTTPIQYFRQQRNRIMTPSGKSANITWSLTCIQLDDSDGNNAIVGWSELYESSKLLPY